MNLLPYILFEKYFLYFSVGSGQPGEPALCRLYRDLRTFVPCAQFAVIIYYKVQPTQPPVFTAVFQIHLCCRLVGGVA